MKGIKSTMLFILLSICTSCHLSSNNQIVIGFYYWKTNFHLTGFEQRKLDSLNCKTLYIRLFDVDWDKVEARAHPIAVSHIQQQLEKDIDYRPVIFITQSAINNTTPSEIETLAKNLTRLLYQKCIQDKINPKEIQIDCDWTRNNKEKYFQLLRYCKKQDFFKEKKLTCTVRLHQIRYPAINGVPPVDKGVLMCYNMGNLKLAGYNNSILDLTIAKHYLSRLEYYPLPLDIALPVFSWSLLYDNQNRFKGILRDVRKEQLISNSLFIPFTTNQYKVSKDTVWNGYSLQKGETIRYESCSTEDLNHLADYVNAKTHQISTLIFYHCDSSILSNYKNYELEKICHYFN